MATGDMATQRSRTRTGLAALLAKGTVATVALGAAAIGVSSLAFPAPASAKTAATASFVVETGHVAKLGTVLTTATGRTLYRYTVDPAGKATCTGACAKVWPPLLLPKGVTHIKAPHGVKGLTAIRVHGGRFQVFFHDHALYRFISDSKKGVATGQGVESDWFAVLSNGKSSASTSASTPTSTSSGSGPSGGGGSSTSTSTTSPKATKTPSGGTSTTSPPTTAPVTKAPTPTTAPPTTTPTTTAPPTTTPPTSPPTTTTTTAPPTGGVGF
jgi:predicted lipoprotein with Yx(FWY)xxD motif